MDDNFDVFQTMTTTPRTFPRMDLFDVQNNAVNVESLASSHHLILITLKSIPCPVCPQLLKILNMYGLDPDANNYIDPFTLQEFKIDQVRKRFFRLLLKYDAYFIILCPGSNQDVRQVQENTPFLDYPFIAGEQANQLAKALKVQLSDQEFMPAILEVSKGTLSVDPIYIGRGPGHYFHHYLLKRLIEERCKMEMKGIIYLRDMSEIINQLKRKITKCQDGKMASPSLNSWKNGLNIDKSPLSARLLSTSPLKRSPPLTPAQAQEEEAATLSAPTSPVPSLSNTATTTKDTTLGTTTTTTTATKEEDAVPTKEKRRSLDDLPLELLEIVFNCFSNDIPSLVKLSATCRAFYIAVCNVMILRLRNQMTWLKPALPHQQQGNVLEDEAEVTDQSLDRWSGSQTEEGIPFRELQDRVLTTKDLISNITFWTRHWNPAGARRLNKRERGGGGIL